MILRLVLLAGAAAWIAGRLVPAAQPWAVFGAWVGLGLAPGVALSRFLAPLESTPLTVCRAMFLGPLFTGCAGLGLLLAGVDAALASYVLLAVGFLLGVAAVRGRPAQSASPVERRLAWLVLGLALMVLVPHVAREWVRIRSDAVFHSAVALEIALHGAPPQDPYFAGLSLNYVWFYHSLVALLARAAASPPWHVTGLLQAGWFASLGGAAFAVSRRLGRTETESWFAALFVPLGLGALFMVWLPLKVARGLTGETAGWDHVRHLLSLRPFVWDQVFHVQSTWKSPPPVVNKYLVMTAWGGAFTALAWLAEGAAAAARLGSSWSPSRAPFLLVAFSTYGAWVLHPAMGLLTAVGGGLTLLLLLLRPGPVGRGAVGRIALGFVIGSLPATLLLAVSAAQADTVFPLGFDPRAARGAVVGCTAALALGIPGLIRLPRSSSTYFAWCLAVGLSVGSLLVVLPPPNTADKIPFGFYLMPALGAGWLLGRVWARRSRRALWTLAVVALLGPVNVLYVSVLLVEPAGSEVTHGETALHDWLRTETPADAVVLDTAERADLLLHVPRRQYWGRESYAQLWGYSTEEMNQRRGVRDALVSPDHPSGATEQIQAHAVLCQFARDQGVDVYVILRTADFPLGVPALDPERFVPVHTTPQVKVLRLVL